ncbi:Polyadenylate-binding protein-interacting protein 1 [Eumeta japonica]|uniref:Polyadenylate-binding protein-interacting protein 1 n=1 Tax=Eumeta variegata TaxID=151549 RepID=A0A4C2AJ58_EUMVA|nr:Polyadenylate-binding protein-interacting protein 1 [Eumeta japonica]
MNNGEIGGTRGRGRGWQQGDSQPRELRRPRILPDDSKVVPPKSNLSADAKEWYPPNYTPVQPAPVYQPETVQYRPTRFSVQNRLRQAQEQDIYNFDEMSISLEDQENMDLRESIGNLIRVMCEITFCPGKFDTLCGPLVDTFASSLHDVNYTKPLVDAIVNQSIAEPNFRYNGARLCSMYDSVADEQQSCFRACLLERCTTEEGRIVSGSETSEENMRGFAMFLAEIYTQLEDSQGRRIRSLGESLCKVLLHLLDTDSETNIKAVCQLLKLSGIALDADCPSSMQAAFERLRRRALMPCVRAVVALRDARWGLAEPTLPPPAGRRHLLVTNGEGGGEGGDGEGEGAEGGYLADGHVLTAEERAFLQTHLPHKATDTLEDDILEELENDAWDTGMDPEMQAGYLEFLRLSNQIRR